ncbi:MAG: hypothetical protein CMK49_01445 [Prochlorococcus sp. SP3034]|nr:hypothetical protein [Prochlorococcus sp. SP3034]|tara:strand:- start:3114 stop:3368 length:255 start_codon:yes stop_codon:yes gene_type:complete
MKIINLVFQFLMSISLIAIFLYWSIAFDSAFEADRACHSDLSSYLVETERYGCDHDTETHQWILYKNLDVSEAEIIKRFRYKFL